MGTILALLLIFGGFGAITGAVKAFGRGMQEGVQRGRREAREREEQTRTHVD